MPLVKDRQIVSDTFAVLADDAELPSSGDVLVSATRFLADPAAILRES